MKIDWEKVVTDATLYTKGKLNTSGVQTAQKVIELIIGEDNLQEAVDYYVSNKTGSEIVRSVLWHLRPSSAMNRCYDIFCGENSIEDRRSAIELLRVVADKKALSWVTEILNDPDDAIQNWGAGIVDQLLFSEIIEPDECEAELRMMSKHKNKKVVEIYNFIKGYLKEREE